MISANMSRTEIADAIRSLWQQTDAIQYSLKKIIRSMDEEDNEDRYYAHQSLLDQLDHIAGRLDDADTYAEKTLRS